MTTKMKEELMDRVIRTFGFEHPETIEFCTRVNEFDDDFLTLLVIYYEDQRTPFLTKTDKEEEP